MFPKISSTTELRTCAVWSSAPDAASTASVRDLHEAGPRGGLHDRTGDRSAHGPSAPGLTNHFQVSPDDGALRLAYQDNHLEGPRTANISA